MASTAPAPAPPHIHRITSSWHPINNGCGELPVWHEPSGTLAWIDIPKKRVHRITDLERPQETHEQFDVPDENFAGEGYCTGVFITEDGPDAPWLVLRRYDLGWYDPHTQSFSLIASILDAEGGGAAAEARLRNVRLNEAHTDPLGRLWIATKLEPDVEKPIATEEEMEQGKGERPVGAVYLFDPRTGKLEKKFDGVHLANSLSISGNGKHFYFGDSTLQTVWHWDLDLPSGTLSNKRRFVQYDGLVINDGMCLDTEGNVYIAVFNGGRVDVFDPQGQLRTVIDVPHQCPTCPLLAGPNLDQLIITTKEVEAPIRSAFLKAQGEKHPQLANDPQALEKEYEERYPDRDGHVYRIALPGVRGDVMPLLRGKGK